MFHSGLARTFCVLVAIVTLENAASLPPEDQTHLSGVPLLYLHYGTEVVASVTSPAHRVDLAGTEGFPLIFTARNTGSGTIHMLNRMTPFEGLLDDLLIVRNEAGKHMPYKGATASRRPVEDLTMQDYVVIGPGQSKRVTLDIADEYGFDGDGLYSIRLKQPSPKTVKYKDIQELKIQVTGAAERTEMGRAKLEEAFNNKARHDRMMRLRGESPDHLHFSEFSDAHTCDGSQLQKVNTLRKIVKNWLRKAQKKHWAHPEEEGQNYILNTLRNMEKHWDDSNFNCCSDELVDAAQQKADPKAAYYQAEITKQGLFDKLLQPGHKVKVHRGIMLIETRHPDDRRIVHFPDGTKAVLEKNGSVKGHVEHVYKDGSTWVAKPNHCLNQHDLKANSIAAFVHPAKQGPRVINICPGAFGRISILAMSFIHEMSHFIDAHSRKQKGDSITTVETEIDHHAQHAAHGGKVALHTDEGTAYMTGHVALHPKVLLVPRTQNSTGTPNTEDTATGKQTYLHSWGESTCLVIPRGDKAVPYHRSR